MAGNGSASNAVNELSLGEWRGSSVSARRLPFTGAFIFVTDVITKSSGIFSIIYQD
jgi:hypothetical protein